MAEPLDSVVAAFRERRYLVSLHHWEQIVMEDRPTVSRVVAGIAQDAPEVIRVYERDKRGQACLILCVPPNTEPIHVVVGFDRSPMTIITAYEPDPEIWNDDNRTEKEAGTP